MDIETKDKWLEALRSGEYEQAKHVLHRDGSYCCLGVLWECTGRIWHDKAEGVARPSSLGFVEFFSREYDIPTGEVGLLASMNDGGATFGEIAAHIEAKL